MWTVKSRSGNMGVIILAPSSCIDVGRVVTSIYVVDAVFSLNSMINDEKYFFYLHSLSCSFTYFPHSLLPSLTSTSIFPVSQNVFATHQRAKQLANQDSSGGSQSVFRRGKFVEENQDRRRRKRHEKILYRGNPFPDRLALCRNRGEAYLT